MGVAKGPAVRTASALTVVALGAAAFVISTRDGDDSSAEPAATTTTTMATATSTTPTSPATTLPPTTSTTSTTTTTTTTTTAAPTTTTTTTTTTTAPTTTTVPATLPQPIDAPADQHSTEPVVELGGISIPKIGLEQTMYEGIRLPTLDRGPGHWPGTALPGQAGNVVVAGHRTSHNADFRHLDQLAAGDEVIFTNGDSTSTYVVESVEIVGPDAMWIVDQTAEPTATLFACHPPGSVAERIVVHLALRA